MSISQCEETQTPRLGNLVKTRVTMLPGLPQTILVYACCPGTTIKSVSFHSHKLPSLDNKLCVHLPKTRVSNRQRQGSNQAVWFQETEPTHCKILPPKSYFPQKRIGKKAFFFSLLPYLKFHFYHTLNFLHGYKPIRGAVGKRHVFCNYIRL